MPSKRRNSSAQFTKDAVDLRGCTPWPQSFPTRIFRNGLGYRPLLPTEAMLQWSVFFSPPLTAAFLFVYSRYYAFE